MLPFDPRLAPYYRDTAASAHTARFGRKLMVLNAIFIPPPWPLQAGGIDNVGRTEASSPQKIDKTINLVSFRQVNLDWER